MDSPLERFKALWLRLDALDRSGLLESPEAESIREDSEGPWDAMSEAERAELTA